MGARLADGVLLVDKPAGLTSHDIVAIVRRLGGQRRVGHAGTLDPFATGLLVLLLGRATRLLPYLAGEPKVYDAVVAFGHETDTDDATGVATLTGPAPSRAALDAALASLTGAIQQVPPAYSAKQQGGQRAYVAARRGAPLDLAPVAVTVHEWRMDAWDGETLRATVTCSGGTYVRALARDLGRAARSAAHLETLRRTRSGPFRVEEAATLDALEQRGVATHLRSPLEGLEGLCVEALDHDAIERVKRGMPVGASAPGERAALVDRERRLVAVAVREGTEWRPRVVMGDDDAE
ncbi:MAG TPA: tRNA pseudouridine(55) synthase TruB [Gemmatimonadaceae bacterium]|nr:tRNA pseudouridine(55) synthase TruB [Gemmatimonadaceae bacterium]